MSHPGEAQGFPPGAPEPVPAAAPPGAAQQWGQPAAAPYAATAAPVGTTWAPPTAPPAAPTPPGLPFGLTPADIRESLRTVARAFLPALAALTVLSAVVALVATPDGYGGSLGDWLLTAVTLLALALGGRLVASGSISEEMVGAQLDVAVRVMPLVLTVVVLALVARHSARSERREPATTTPHLLARAVLTGLVAGVGTAIVTALASTSTPYGLDVTEDLDVAAVSVGAGVLGAFVGATLLVAAVSGVARAVVAGRSLPVSAELRTVLAVLRTALVGLTGSAVAVLVLGWLYEAILTDHLDDGRIASLGGLLVFGVNAVVVLVLGALGVPAVWSAQASGGGDFMDLFDDMKSGSAGGSLSLFDDKVALLALLVPVAVALGTAVRWSLRRPDTQVTVNALKLAAGTGAVAGLAAALLVRISVSGSASGAAQIAGETLGQAAGSAGASAGMSLLWAPILGAAWAAAIVWALRLGPTLALSLPVRITRLLGGRGIDPRWAAALAGTGPAPAGTRSPGLRLGALITGIVLVVAALGAGVVAVVNAVVFTPQSAAEDYLDAVADADAAKVLTQLADAPKVNGQPFLSRAVLTSDDFTPIRNVSVGDVREYGDSATVDVAYTVGDSKVRDSISLVAGDKTLGLFRDWKVSESLPQVTVYSDSTLGEVLAGDELPQGDFLALPGRYRVHAADDPLLTSDDSVFTVTTDEPTGPSLSPEVKPEALAAAKKAIDARIAGCLQSTTLPLENCPFLSYWSSYSGDISGLQLTMTEKPQYSLEYDSYDGVLDIVTEEYGELRMTGTQTVTYFSLPPEQRPYEDEFSFSVDGEVSVSGDDLVVSFDE